MSRVLTLLALVLLLGATACSSDDASLSGPGTAGEIGLPAPTTPEQLMANLDTAISTLDVDEYAALLHEDFTFWFSPDDISLLGVVSWTRAQELAAITNLFSGETGTRTDESGNPEVIPAVSSIDIVYVQQQAWRSDFADGSEFDHAELRGVFDCTFTARYTDPNSITIGTGEAVFYLIGVPVEVDGEMQTQFQIAAWKDLGNRSRVAIGAVGTETGTWGRLKALFLAD